MEERKPAAFPAYKKIDLSVWPRREHFQYYRNQVKCGYSLTARADVTKALSYAESSGHRFYACFIHAAARAVNQMDSMKLMLAPDGQPGIWERVHPNFTVFHKDDETFSDLWTEYKEDLEEFCSGFEQVLAEYGDCHGIKGRPGQPANFFCISCVPWLDFTGYSTSSTGDPALFPIITFGKYTWSEGRCTLPVTLTISHAAADGYHSSMFFQKLQQELDRF